MFRFTNLNNLTDTSLCSHLTTVNFTVFVVFIEIRSYTWVEACWTHFQLDLYWRFTMRSSVNDFSMWQVVTCVMFTARVFTGVQTSLIHTSSSRSCLTCPSRSGDAVCCCQSEINCVYCWKLNKFVYRRL